MSASWVGRVGSRWYVRRTVLYADPELLRYGTSTAPANNLTQRETTLESGVFLCVASHYHYLLVWLIC